MRVAAEGLETASQLATLRQLQCELGQGFYFSRPVDGEAADDLLSSQARW
jgi:EAL domain-containing protein (putative c-di-GMP-specific phosphodiesterase class I)